MCRLGLPSRNPVSITALAKNSCLKQKKTAPIRAVLHKFEVNAFLKKKTQLIYRGYVLVF
jgi:hypothetical protein